MRHLVLTAIMLFLLSALNAQDLIKLPAPDTTGGKPLMQALKERQSQRSFSEKELPTQLISNLLWAAAGINRPNGKRTAPTASNKMEIDIYAATANGLYLYDAVNHQLQPVMTEDIRPSTGKQDFVKTAPIVLVYVADYARMNKDEKVNDFYSATDVGFVSQNVYLFSASENLATVVLGWVDKPALAGTMKLKTTQKVLLTQPVGYPAQ